MGAGHAHRLYRQGDSPVHALPPHTKLAAAFAFVVVVMGGMGSVAGAALAAVGVGLVQQFANYYTASGLGDLAVVVLLAALLLLKPRGITGRLA